MQGIIFVEILTRTEGNINGVDFIFLYPAVPQIFYFKHDVGVFKLQFLLATLIF